eukprot:Em0562g6a
MGISLSLYDRKDGTVGRHGDPIADVYAVVVRQNNTILAVADGCSWGHKPRLAARCAVRGSMEYLTQKLFNGESMVLRYPTDNSEHAKRQAALLANLTRVIQGIRSQFENEPICAWEVKEAIVKHVIDVTNNQRGCMETSLKNVDNPELSTLERRAKELEFKEKLKTMGGKLDHATLAVYEHTTTLGYMLQSDVQYDIVLGTIALTDKVVEHRAIVSQSTVLVNSGDYVELVMTQCSVREVQCKFSVTQMHELTFDGQPVMNEYDCPVLDLSTTIFCIWPNNAILAIADGWNWGPNRGRQLAAQFTEVLKSFKNCSSRSPHPQIPRRVTFIRMSFDRAQELIMKHESTTTSLWCGSGLPLVKSKGEWGLCVVSVGNSSCFVWQNKTGVAYEGNLAAIGSSKDALDYGGCLGPSIGDDPDLSNLLCCYATVSDDDRRSQRRSDHLSALALKDALVEYVVEATEAKRTFLERSWHSVNDPDLTTEERAAKEKEIFQLADGYPGKLDHATMVAYQVGVLSENSRYKPNRRHFFFHQLSVWAQRER